MTHRTQITISRLISCALALVWYATVPAAHAQTPVASEKIKRPTEIESRLQSLRRSVENATDIKGILDRYARFIEQYKESPVAKDAEKDMAMWKDRLANGQVKVGKKWVTPAEREILKAKALGTAIEARDAMIQVRMAEAEAMVLRALEEDPANVGAIYLNGVILYGQNQKQAAKKCFETVAVAVPLEGSTLNNLAVIQSDLSQPSLAIKLYDQAMLASRMNKQILHNVAEALNTMPLNQKTTIVSQNAIRVFETQQAQLIKKMEEKGLSPWGASWVDQAMLAKLQAVEKQIQEKVKVISGEYDKVQLQINTVNADVKSNERTMQLLQAATSYRDAKGVQRDRPLSPQYYVLERRNADLANELEAMFQRKAEFSNRATQAEQEMPVRKFTGSQLLIGAEGMPVPSPKAGILPTTKP